MLEFIKVNGQEYPVKSIYNYNDHEWDNRETVLIHLPMSYTEVVALLTNGVKWSKGLREEREMTDQTEEIVTEEDMSAYSLAGGITDHRDGIVSIKMGKPTETESAKATVTALAGEPVTYARAVELRPIIEQAAVSLSDGEAASVPELITAWAYPVAYAEGDRRSYGGKVYKVRPGQGHTSQADWTPDKTPNLWAVIDAEHAGTQADPIPASRGMEYEYGKYYLDGEDGKTYLCERTGEAAGSTIVLQYMPHELVGNYFELAN